MPRTLIHEVRILEAIEQIFKKLVLVTVMPSQASDLHSVEESAG